MSVRFSFRVSVLLLFVTGALLHAQTHATPLFGVEAEEDVVYAHASGYTVPLM